MKKDKPPQPVHVKGTHRGEEIVKNQGREPGRGHGGRSYRTARDSTSIDPENRDPILPEMPNIPPA